MKLPATQALYAYWSSQCRGRCAPDRHDLDPAAMRGVLSHTFMLEVGVASGTFPIRISGTRLDALFGRGLKGANFPDLCAGSDGAAVRDALQGVLDEANPALVGLAGAPAGGTREAFELLILPLRHHGRTHARLLCGLFAARTPSWLGLQFVERLSLTSWRTIDRRAEAAAQRGGADAMRRAHLVVHQGGRGDEVHSAPSAQWRVKEPVASSRDLLLLTRSS